MTPQVQYWKELAEAAMTYIEICHCDPDTTPEQLAAWNELLAKREEIPPAPAQGVEEADHVIRDIYNRHAAINGDTEPDPYGHLLKGTGKAEKLVISFVRELFAAGSRWQQGQGGKFLLDKPDLSGWSYEYKFLKDLTYRVTQRDGGEHISMEQVEAVLLEIGYGSGPAPTIEWDEGKYKEAIENALYATRRFLTTDASDLAEYIISYLKDAGIMSPSPFPTREQAQEWVKSTCLSPKNMLSTLEEAVVDKSLAMYDWIVQQLKQK